MTISIAAGAEETTLFNSQGTAIAYTTDDLTVYMWNGDPVAYLSGQDRRFSIYSYNGTHLGWFIGGVIYDHKGNSVGFTKAAGTGVITSMEPEKGVKVQPQNRLTPAFPPAEPIPTGQWSPLDLESLLRNEAQ